MLVLMLLALIGGAGKDAHWKSPLPIQPLLVRSRPEPDLAVQPLASMQVIWKHTLFEPSRTLTVTAKEATPSAKLEGIILTGVVQTPSLHVALLQDASGKPLRIPLDGIYQGWRLASLEPRRAIFTRGTDRSELTFPVSDNKPAQGTLDSHSGQSATLASSAPQASAMMTNAATQAQAPSANDAPVDDVAVRQARMDALKKIVMQRRQAASSSTGSP
jgi:general secretion pathway protein N